jgi:hypothetical protein
MIMAKVKNGSNVSGKVGELVYYEMNGKQFVRSAPKLVSKRTRKKKETEPQKMTRMRFKWAFHMVGQVREHIGELYQETKGKGSPFHKAVGRIVKTALRGNEPETLRYDFELMPFAHGSLVFPPHFKKQLIENDGKKQLELSWDGEISDPDDTLSYLIIWLNKETRTALDPLKLEYTDLIHTKTKRKDARYILDISELSEQELLKGFPLSVYVYFRNEGKKLNSDSVNCYLEEK